MRRAVWLAIAYASRPIYAANSVTFEEAVESCAEVHKAAKQIMLARQNGAAMPDAIKIVEGNEFFTAVVRDAYDRPRYTTKANQEREADEFADAVYATCLDMADQLKEQ